MSFSEKIKFVFSSIFAFLLPFIKQFLTDIGALLAKTALEVVTEVQAEMPDAKGSDKAKEAFKQITKKMADAGFVLGTSIINSSIEAAVAKLKE